MDPTQNNSFDSLTSNGGTRPGDNGQTGAMNEQQPVGMQSGDASGQPVAPQLATNGRPGLSQPETMNGQPLEMQPSAQFIGTNLPVNSGSGDIILNNSDKKTGKKWILIGVIVAVLVIVGVVFGVIFGMKGGDSDVMPTADTDVDLPGLVYYGTNEEWEQYYGTEMKRINDALAKTNGSSASSLNEQKNLLELLNVYREIGENFEARQMINSYTKSGDASREALQQALDGMNRIASYYASDYYDDVLQKYDISVEIAKQYESVGCIDELRNVRFDCELSEELSNTIEQQFMKIDDLDLNIENVIENVMVRYGELTVGGNNE